MLQIVPEEYILKMSLDPDLPMDNFYRSLLNAGDIYKKENLTPVYIYSYVMSSFMVTSEERMSKKFN